MKEVLYRYTADLSIYIDKDHLHEHLESLLLSSIENTNSSNFHLRNGFVLERTLHNTAKKFNKELSISYYHKSL